MEQQVCKTEDYINLQNLLSQIQKIKNEWQDTIDCMKQMVILTDISDKILRCNKTFKDFLNKPFESIIGQNFYTLMSGIDINLNNLNADGETDVYLEQHNVWLNIHITPFRSSINKEINGAVIFINNITEIKTLTESLEIVNAKINKEKLDLQSALDEITFLLKEVEQKGDLSVRFVLSDDLDSDFIFRLGNNFNNMMDILQSQHAELETAYSELKKAQSQILQREKMASIGQIAAGVAHEINNPMGFIMSNLTTLGKYTSKLIEFIKKQEETIETLASGCSKELASQCISNIQETYNKLKINLIKEDISNLLKESLDGADRISKIVQNLKSFARVDEIQWKLANINKCIENAVSIIWNELKYKVTINYEFGDIPDIYCNPAELNQVIMNLLLNASQAIESQGLIEIKTWQEDSNVFISIKDNGCGIADEHINRIFEPFFTTKDVGKGTGLGLSISYDIIKRHDGDITVKSKLDEGTTFTIRLPIMEQK